MEKEVEIVSYPPPAVPPPSPNGVTAQIVSCKQRVSCVLQELENLKHFLQNREAEKYYGVTLKWKHSPPIMHVFHNGTLHGTVDLTKYNDKDNLHEVFQKAGLLHMPEDMWKDLWQQGRERKQALEKILLGRRISKLPPHHKYDKDEITNRILRLQAMKGHSAIAFNEFRHEQKLQQKEQKLPELYKANEENQQLWIYTLLGFFVAAGMLLAMAIIVKSRRRQSRRRRRSI